MAIVRYDISELPELTDEQIKMLEEAAKRPIVYDEDAPELTKEELSQFRRVSEVGPFYKPQSAEQNVTIRLSQKALKKAKSLGEGYTTVLSRIIENAMDDPEAIKAAM